MSGATDASIACARQRATERLVGASARGVCTVARNSRNKER